jgi:hypothetical protein
MSADQQPDNPNGRLTAEPSPVRVRHPRSFVLRERAAADVRPYAAPKEQQSEAQSE